MADPNAGPAVDPETLDPGEQPGLVLTGRALMTALECPDRVFNAASWSRSQVRAAGYDLRLAGDLLVGPSNGDDGEYLAVEDGDPEIAELTLKPGDTALLSTVEHFSLDLDIAGQVTAKFRWAARGLIILSGTAIHPGYGRYRNSAGKWCPKEKERLYLIVANSGPANIVLRRNDTIAYLQLITVAPGEVEPEERNLGFEYLRSNLFGSHHGSLSAGLAYFRTVKDLQVTVESAEQAHKTEMRDLRQDVEEVSAVVDRVQSATNTVVVFGVYLVAVTILGIVVTNLINIVSHLPSKLPYGGTWITITITLIYAVTSCAAVLLVSRAVAKRRDRGN